MGSRKAFPEMWPSSWNRIEVGSPSCSVHGFPFQSYNHERLHSHSNDLIIFKMRNA